MQHLLGNIQLGAIPRVVGTIRDATSFPPSSVVNHDCCDVVEARIDRMNPLPEDWLCGCRRIEDSGLPVIVTQRLAQEGGCFTGADESREKLLSEALEHVATVDVEYTSKLLSKVCAVAAGKGKSVIVSHHDFDGTPSLQELMDIADRIRQLGNGVPKIATMVHGNDDVAVLRDLLVNQETPICVIGMGSAGTTTRTSFPLLGSSLTYGYLDSPCAPGQLPASQMVEQLRMTMPAYNEDLIVRKQLRGSV